MGVQPSLSVEVLIGWKLRKKRSAMRERGRRSGTDERSAPNESGKVRKIAVVDAGEDYSVAR